MVLIFHCFEFLLIKKLDDDPDFWNVIKNSVLKENDNYVKAVPPDLWFYAITIAETKDRFPSFVKKISKESLYIPCSTDRLLNRYLRLHDFVEMHLDNIFKYGEKATLPKELFRCPNLKVLSLKNNFLEQLLPDIGKLQKLEHLALTNNRLQNSSIPYSLSFCRSLKVLSLNNNLLDALPGFLLTMPKLNTVHRHGNHNYFKATFMWYHTDVNERILPVNGCSSCMIQGCSSCLPEFPTLKSLSATAIVASKINFFTSFYVPQVLVDYLCNIYCQFNLCYNCFSANPKSKLGYKVYTFRNPYLGNSFVPFQHWACSMRCAQAIEVPAREEQLLAAVEQDKRYNQCVKEAHNSNGHRNKSTSIINLNCCIL